MIERGAYRGLAIAGTISVTLVLTLFSISISGIENNPDSLLVTLVVTGIVVGVVLRPQYEPRPRRVTDLFASTVTRGGVACLALSPIGYYTLFTAGYVDVSFANLSFISTPASIGVVFLCLSLVLPLWFWSLRRYTNDQRAIVVGDDSALFTAVTREVDTRPLGILSPVLDIDTTRTGREIDESSLLRSHRHDTSCGSEEHDSSPAISDGGFPQANSSAPIDVLPRLGGLSRLKDVRCRHDVDTVALAFRYADHAECFGVLQNCHDIGIDVYAHEAFEKRIHEEIQDTPSVEGEQNSEFDLQYVRSLTKTRCL